MKLLNDSSKTFKPLTKINVLKAAEELMTINDYTTTLDVKNALREEGYFAVQADVSLWMEELAYEEGWLYQSNGTHRFYAFGEDTKEALHQYFEKGNYFWEIVVEGVSQFINTGKIGTFGCIKHYTFNTNRGAIFDSELLVQDKILNRYERSENLRPSFTLRLKYFDYFQQRVSRCTLSYFGIRKTEKEDAYIYLGDQVAKAYFLIQKNAGYEFSFKGESGLNQLSDLLRKTEWDAHSIAFDDIFLLGEKVISEKAFLLGTGEQLGIHNLKERSQSPQLVELLIHNDHLYKIELEFVNGQTIQLDKRQMDLHEDLFPLVNLFLKTNGINE